MKTQKYNKNWFIVLFVVILLATWACGGSAPKPDASEATEETPIPPSEEIGGATLQWFANPNNATMAIVAVGGIAMADDATGIGVVDEPIALILIAGIATYAAVVQNPELIAQGAEAIVTGVEGVRVWVRNSFEITVPLAFNPHAGKVEIRAPGVQFIAHWSANSLGCGYDGFLNSSPLKPLQTQSGEPCSPADFLAWIASQLDYLRSKVGDRADELLRALNDLIGPFVK